MLVRMSSLPALLSFAPSNVPHREPNSYPIHHLLIMFLDLAVLQPAKARSQLSSTHRLGFMVGTIRTAVAVGAQLGPVRRVAVDS